MRKYLAAVALFMAVPAMAGITSLNPPSFNQNSGEHFITINGTNLGDQVIYDGPAGTFAIDINASTAGSVIAWVPLEILATPGTYSLVVRGGPNGDQGPAYFDVNGKRRIPLYIIVPERLLAIALGRYGAYVQYEVQVDGGDVPDPIVSCDPKPGSLFPFGASTIRCVATNGAGETAEATISVTVYDPNPPVLKLPKRMAVTAESKEGAKVWWEISAEDDIDGEVPVECDPKQGSLFPIGVTTVNCVANDLSLNPGAGSFLVEVVEKESVLKLDVPEEVVAEAESREGAVVLYEVGTSGSLDPDPKVSCDPPSGGLFPVGETSVNCTASDQFGGRADAKFQVRVVDTTAPSLRLERPSVEATDGKEIQVYFEATATDAIDGKVDVTCKPGPGSYFELGETSVECSAADKAGNVASGLTTVSVVDTIPPVIDGIRIDPEIIEKADGELVPIFIEIGAYDAVDAMPRCHVLDVTANQELDDDWILETDLDLRLRAETNGKEDRRYDILVGCHDDFGNYAIETLNVFVLSGSSASSGSATTTPPPSTKKRSVRP
jgi:hypothetical protein